MAFLVRRHRFLQLFWHFVYLCKTTTIYSKFLSHHLECWMIKKKCHRSQSHRCDTLTEHIHTHEATRQTMAHHHVSGNSSPLLHYQHNSKKYNNEQQDASNDSSNFNSVVRLFLGLWDWFWSSGSWRWKEMRKERQWVRENKDVTFFF